ncbi:MAG: tetratricopeptide repeat protein [Anaerolineae bacterium]|nr:tetratricopeptide repeat protein [Anaerolineae bacterium]
MSKLYVTSQAHTPLDGVRQALHRAKRATSDITDADLGPVELLHLFDQIEDTLEQLEQQDVDVRVERAQFESVQRQLDRRKGKFLRCVGQALARERSRIEPARSHWWWYLDQAAGKQRRRRLRRVAAGTVAVIVVLVAAWLAYQEFLAPPPEVGQAYRRMEAGKAHLAEGDVRGALEAYTAATALTPDDPEPWLWKGVLHDQLGEQAGAREAFAIAERLYETWFDFMLNRGRVYLQSGDVEKAEADAQAAIEEDPTSGWGYYLRAGVAVREGDQQAALADLEQAIELAQERGNGSLEAMAITQRAQLIQMGSIPTPD